MTSNTFSIRTSASTLIGLSLLLIGCGDSAQNAGQTGAPPPVTVSTPVVREITEWDEYTGRFVAVDSVEVRARVSGYLESVNFEDGQIVNQGDLLFVIDPRPFRIALERAEAELVQAETRLDLAIKDLERARPLLERNAISEQVFDERLQSRQEGEAAKRAAQAAVDAARLDLEFSQVRAPISGRVSREFVSIGNLVGGGGASSTLLTTIVSLDPIHFYFDVSEAEYLKYVRLSASGERASSRDVANPVFVQLSDEDSYPHEGRMDFVDNIVDYETGTMRGRAIFPNEDLLLTPGLFGRARLLGSGTYAALMLPDDVIGTDQSRRFVYVVDDDNSVSYRSVELGPLIDGLRVIRSGISANDSIIINGLQRVRPGSTVAPEAGTITVAAEG